MLQTQIKQLFSQQTTDWDLAKKNFADLKTVQTKSFSFDRFQVHVQYNPARMVSSGAKVDAKSIAERKCFLCDEHLPAEQKGILWRDFQILVNPFPIFPTHFTIRKTRHLPQQILPVFIDMLELTYELDEFAVFYNGPKCGASAPDHMHFQAGTKEFLPLINDYKNMKNTHAVLLQTEGEAELLVLNDYLRTVYCIESYSIYDAQVLFCSLYSQLQKEKDVEPMMNIVCSYEGRKWHTFILPREAFRPRQYDADPERQLLISPATVEMCGVFIAPVAEHFERISSADIVDILQQCTLSKSIK